MTCFVTSAALLHLTSDRIGHKQILYDQRTSSDTSLTILLIVELRMTMTLSGTLCFYK
jgi:hypothetical protein